MSKLSSRIEFGVDWSDCRAHVFRVSMKITQAPSHLCLSLPVWTPGSYMVREFAQHIISLKVSGAAGGLKAHKINKNTFELNNQTGDIIVEYEVYAFDSSIRAAYLDDKQAFFNGTALLLRPHGLEEAGFKLAIRKAKEPWQVATGMTKIEVDSDGFGTYYAANYDELVDHPVQISTMKRLKFAACGIPHEIVLVGDVRLFDEVRLIQDLTQLCASQIAIFDGQVSFEHYLFIARFEEGGFGGLEHRNSSMLLCTPASLAKPGLVKYNANYSNFLSLCSHEYFHAWNVKSLKPLSFVPYNYDQESYTTMLWVFEGITAYYDDLMLRKAGLIAAESYLELLAKNISRLLRNQGRLVQSLSDASFDSWIKFYRPNENSPNSTISYYLKGSLLALCLDLEIRGRNRGQKSLDQVISTAFARFGDGRGMSEQSWLSILSEIGGVDSAKLEALYLHGTAELPLEEHLNQFGIKYELLADELFIDEKTKTTAYLGCKWRFDDNQRAIISFVETKGPAMLAGLSAGDEIIAIDSIRLEPSTWPELALSMRVDQALAISFSRKKLVFDTSLTPLSLPLTNCRLTMKTELSDENRDLRAGWLAL